MTKQICSCRFQYVCLFVQKGGEVIDETTADIYLTYLTDIN